jgi:hypothetical protein
VRRLRFAYLGALRQQSRDNQEKNWESQGLPPSFQHDQPPLKEFTESMSIDELAMELLGGLHDRGSGMDHDQEQDQQAER